MRRVGKSRKRPRGGAEEDDEPEEDLEKVVIIYRPFGETVAHPVPDQM